MTDYLVKKLSLNSRFATWMYT